MKKKTLEEKIDLVRATRAKNYEESLRLEGFPENIPSHGKTKSEVIEYGSDNDFYCYPGTSILIYK